MYCELAAPVKCARRAVCKVPITWCKRGRGSTERPTLNSRVQNRVPSAGSAGTYCARPMVCSCIMDRGSRAADSTCGEGKVMKGGGACLSAV